MDYWPTRYDAKHSVYKKGKARDDAKGQMAMVSRAYPLAEQGSIAAANLIRYGGKLEWTFLGQNDSGRRLRTKGSPVKIFPATYPKRSRSASLNVTQQAELGAHFLRTYYPDVDIASDLIRNELTDEARRGSELAMFDPHIGNKLAFVTCSERTRRKSAYFAFPMGPTGCDLNLSQMSYSKRDRVTFVPSTKVVKSFDTPIKQIIGYSGEMHEHFQGTYMAIRTTGSTHVAKLQMDNSSPEDVSMITLATWTRSHTGQRHIVDVAFANEMGSRSVSALAVTDRGYVYNCSADSQRSPLLMYESPSDALNDDFWRIVPTSTVDLSLLLSSSSLSLIDFRSKSEAIRLLATADETLTCVDAPSVDHMIRALTTSELVWFDDRYPKTPMFSYKHGRQNDRTLRVQTMSFRGGPLTFLSSSKNDLLTVYDVLQDKSGAVRMDAPAYSLPPCSLEGGHCVGSTLVRHPSELDDDNAVLVRLSDRGSIHRLDFTLSGTEEYMGRTHIWSTEVDRLEKSAHRLPLECGHLSERTFNEIDLEPVIPRIFALNQNGHENDSEAVYTTLDAMQSFWATLDEPIEHMLTTSDVAFRCGTEPDAPSRMDFLTESGLNSTRGYRALVQRRIPIRQITKQAAWHNNIHATIHGFVPELSNAPEDTYENLKVYDLQMDDYRTGPSIRREGEAREQLTLDLLLSTDVYSPHIIKRNPDFSGTADDDAFETMSRATEAMSIGVPEPPAVNFGFLRPVFGKGNDHYAEDKEDHESKAAQPLGVRLLLKDWEFGADPKLYMYYDPYDIPETTRLKPIRHLQSFSAAPRLTQQSQSQKAPPVIATAVPMGPPPIISSQPVRIASVTQWQPQEVPAIVRESARMSSQPGLFSLKDSQSEDILVPSTQVLPGPFGGRPAVKKKPMKKRLGGF